MNTKLRVWALSAAVIAALAGCRTQVPVHDGTNDPSPPRSTPAHPACPEGT
jgi:hypothetical protein